MATSSPFRMAVKPLQSYSSKDDPIAALTGSGWCKPPASPAHSACPEREYRRERRVSVWR